jgi:hypothetical protein
LAEAAHKIKLLIQDFDFATPSDRSRALASILTPALKLGGHLKGSVPADVAEADQSQAGKTYRQRIIAAIYNESPAMVLQRSGGVGSLDETLAQHLLNGATFIQLDNVRGKTNSPYIEALLTADKSFPVRVPYHGSVDIDPSRFFIFLTSNGVEVTRDLANRSSLIRIRKRSGHEFPLYPEGDLLAHVRANQAYYLGCVFAVVREWIKQGRQQSKEYRHDFREWAQTLDWIVQNVFGEAPLLDGHQETQDRISSPAMSFMRELAHHAKAARQLDKELSAAEIYEFAQEDGIDVPGLRDFSDKVGQQTVGRIMGKIFQGREANPCVRVDGFLVKRVIRQVHRTDDKGYSDRKFYVISLEGEKAAQLHLPNHPP